MREHPIPQDITGYRFHIIGNMTLKQFAEVLLGAIIAFIVYRTNLPGFFKWPLVLTFFGMGFAAAFVPIEERPLDHWIITFIKTLYKPTKFYWKKNSRIPEALRHEPGEQKITPTTELDTTHIRRDKIDQFLKSVEPTIEQKDQFDIAQEQRVGQIIQGFEHVKVDQNPVRKAVKPNLQVRTRKIGAAPKPSVVYRAPTNTKEQIDQEENLEKNQPEEQEAKEEANPINEEGGEKQQIQMASQSQDLPFPSKPTQPNRLVGMVTTPDKRLVGDALVELRGSDGQTITAVKSNTLGQFSITQQLNDGEYILYIKKNGLSFDPQKIELTGKIIDPLEITSNE